MEKNEDSFRAKERTPLIVTVRESKFARWYWKRRFVLSVATMIFMFPLLGLLALRKGDAPWTSPIVYPSPSTYGAGNWSIAYEKAKALVSKMTLEEMNNITYGFSDSQTGCVGVSGGVPRLDFPGFCLQDGPAGVRDVDGVNGYGAQLHVGASFNSSLAYQRAQFMGAEFKKKGVNVALGPVVGPIGRIAEGGRNWEGFGADPYLNGVFGAQSVLGLQESVIASVKHFVANEQETNRNPIPLVGIESTSANVDDGTMHELYLWPFQDLIYAGAGCVMCSYNRINQTYGCENSKTINGLLKGELNFQGFVLSDWNGQHSGVPSANAGLDMAMPTSSYWENGLLAEAVRNEDLNRTRLIDMATRIVATCVRTGFAPNIVNKPEIVANAFELINRFQFGQDSPEFPKLGVGMPPDLLQHHTIVDAKDSAARASLLEQAIQGHVLVKNTNGALPLEKPRQLSVFGYDATAMSSFTPGSISVDGITANLFQVNWGAINIQAYQLAEIASNNPVTNAPATAQGTLIVGGGSGSNTPAYISSPYDALQKQAFEDETSLFYDFASTNPNVAASSDACLVFINEFASESWDRPGLADPSSDELVSNVASTCENTIVVIHNAGIRLVDAWIENPNVTAVVFGHLPGQDAGRAIVQILYGTVSPSGRLPYTVAKSADDYGDLLSPCEGRGTLSPQCDFDEGVNIDYRSFLARGVMPRYEFGFGLTYSSFSYSHLIVDVNVTATENKTISAPVYASGTTDENSENPNVGVGGLLSLFESVGTIQATIANTGPVAAAEVPQLYLQAPSMTTRVLRGFQKVLIPSEESIEVTFTLRRKDVSSWNAEKQAWTVPLGTFDVFVGKSVLDAQLIGSFMTEE